MPNAGHHARAMTNQPIIGVLTQPLLESWAGTDSPYTSFFESSHADLLQAAGARIVPIDFTLSESKLKKELA